MFSTLKSWGSKKGNSVVCFYYHYYCKLLGLPETESKVYSLCEKYNLHVVGFSSTILSIVYNLD